VLDVKNIYRGGTVHLLIIDVKKGTSPSIYKGNYMN